MGCLINLIIAPLIAIMRFLPTILMVIGGIAVLVILFNIVSYLIWGIILVGVMLVVK